MKKTLCILVLLSLSFCVYARDITATGEGKTKEEAVNEALSLLTRSIYSNISSSTYSLEYEKSSGISSTFRNEVSVKTDIDLTGIDFNVQRIDRDTYKAEVVITTDKAEQYKSDYLSSLTYIKNNSKTKPGNDVKEAYEFFDILYKTYNKAKTCYIVYNVLTDYKYSIDNVDNYINAYQLELEYHKHLDMYNDYLKRRITGAAYEKDSKEQLEKLQKELQRIDKINKEEQEKIKNKTIIDNHNEQYKLVNELKSRTINNIEENSNLKFLSDIDAFKKISTGKSIFLSTIGKEISIINSDTAKLEKQKNDEIYALQTKPYAAADMANGKPVKEALKEREQDIKEIENNYSKKIQNTVNTYLKNSSNSVAVLDNSYLGPLNELENTTYNQRVYTKTNTNKTDSVIYVYDYNGEKKRMACCY